MKKIFALLLASMLLVASLVIPSFADEGKTPGGLDFYSLTLHYATPVVLDYQYVTKDQQIQVKDVYGNPVVDDNGNPVYVDKGYIFNTAKDSLVISANEYNLANGGNQLFAYEEEFIRSRQWARRFYSIVSKDYGIDSSALEINANYGITNIHNGDTICLISSERILGAHKLFDDAGTPNPNFERDSDGYFLDVNVDENGNPYRIDVNEFVIDANNIWHDSDGRRIEPFIVVDDEYIWIDIASRLDDNGFVIDYKTISNRLLIEKGALTLPDKFKNLDEYDESVDYDGDGTPGKAADKREYNNRVKARDTWLSVCDIMLYRIEFPLDKDGNMLDDLSDYNSPNKTFTGDDILIKKVGDKEVKVNGSAVQGTPRSKVQVTGVTVEIDALGTSMPADIASDPQQKNEIIISLGDLYQNVEAALAYVAEHPEKMYTEGQIVGRAKSVTTKTSMQKEEGLPSTVKSVEVVLDENLEFGATAMFYISFKIEESQPADALNYSLVSKTGYALDPVNKAKINLEALPDVPKPDSTETKTKGCKSVITGSAAIIGVMAAAAVVLRKKEED